MLLILLFLGALVAGVAAILLTRPDEGYVLINYGPWAVETTLAVLVIGVALWFLAVYLGLKLAAMVVRLPVNLRQAVDRRRGERARQSFEAGLLNLFEGNWKNAEVELVRRVADYPSSHLNYMAAARAAHRLGAADRRDHYLRLAALHKPEYEIATLLSGADMQRQHGEHEATRGTALKLRERDPNHPFAIELLAESHAALGEWEALSTLLAEPAARSALSPPRYDALLQQCTRELMQRAVAMGRLDRLKTLWDGVPAYHNHAGLRREYVRSLARLNADAEAGALIEQTLAQEWDPELALLYGEGHANAALTQLAAVEQWLGRYGEKPELLQLAGHVCLRNKLWGKARSYLEAGVQAAPTPQAYLDLARLCQDTQQPEQAVQYYRHGLELAAKVPRT